MRFEKENEKNVSFFHYLCSMKERFAFADHLEREVEIPVYGMANMNKKRNMTVTYKKKDQTNKH